MNRQRWAGASNRWNNATGADLALGREHAVAWAQGVLSEPSTVYLDTETTGFPPAAEVVDLAVVTAAGEILVDTLVRPLSPIPAGATAIHGISDHHVAAAPYWVDIHDLLCDALTGRTVVIYNLDFDRRVLLGCGDRHRLSLPEARWECAMRAYAGYRGERSQRGGQFRLHKLEDAAHHFGHPPGGHRALADAVTCLRVVRGMAGLP